MGKLMGFNSNVENQDGFHWWNTAFITMLIMITILPMLTKIDSNIQTGRKIIQIISMLILTSVSISNGNDNKVTSLNKKQECGKILTATITSHMFVHIHMIPLILMLIT